jgi:hypothetical protein
VTAHDPIKPDLSFERAQVRPRHDGWTAARQIAFIDALAATRCVGEACRARRRHPAALKSGKRTLPARARVRSLQLLRFAGRTSRTRAHTR